MFIKVTNSLNTRAGDPLIININMITSVYEEHVEGGSLMTVIYVSDRLSFNVEESIEQVYKLIETAVLKMNRNVG